MKKRISVILALLLLLTALFQLPLTASAEITMVEVTKGASIRNKPGYDGEKITLATVGSQYMYLGTEGKWYALQMDAGTIGYLPTDSCKLVTAPGIPTGSAQDAFSSIVYALQHTSGFEQDIPEAFSGKAVVATYYDLNGKPEDVSTEAVTGGSDYWSIPEEMLAEKMDEADWALLVYPTITDEEDDPITVNVFAVDLKNTVYYAPYTTDDRATVLENDGSSYDMYPTLLIIEEYVFRSKWERAARLANDEDYQRGLQYMNEGKYYSAYEAFEMSSLEEAREMAQQCIQPWPRTGELWHSSSHKSNSVELTVSVNQPDDYAMLVRIYQKDTPVSYLFIGGTGRATVNLPAGTYVIKDGTGRDWFGLKEAFGRDGSYEIMTFGDDDSDQVKLNARYAYTITINSSSSNPDADSVGSEYENWEGFSE